MNIHQNKGRRTERRLAFNEVKMLNDGYANNNSKTNIPAQLTGEEPVVKNPKGFRPLLKDFASDTSFGGISKATLSDGYIRRFVWTLISATCYGFTIYMCYGLIVNYLNIPISTTVDIVYEKNIQFPAVTICNLNQFRKRKIRSVSAIYDVLELFRDQEKRNRSSTFENKLSRQTNSLKKDASLNSDIDEDTGFFNDVEIDESYIIEQLVAITAANYTPEELSAVGHQYKDMFVSCSWMGLNCKNGYFEKFWTQSWNWKFGNCFTFNAGANQSGHSLRILRTNMPGPNFGLSLDLNIEQSQYIDALVDEAGLKIVIHNPKQVPFPFDEGITVPPGFSSSIAIRKEIIERVDPFKNGSCNPNLEIDKNNVYRPYHSGGGVKYSVKACMMSCLAKEQERVCNCSATQFAHLGNEICEEEDELTCMGDVNNDYKQNQIGCSKKCPQACLHQSFRYSVMMSALTVNKKEVAKKDFGENKTDDDVNNNFLRVNVFYEELNLQKVVQSTPYALENLFGDIGGQLGLWIGISVISVAEFGELLVSLFVVLVRKSRDRKTTTADVMEMK